MKSPEAIPAKRCTTAGNGIGLALLKRAVLGQLERLRHGALVVIEPTCVHHFGSAGATLQGQVQIVDAAAWGMIASNGSIGAGEAYIQGYWTSPDLTAVVRVLVSNLDVLDDLEGGLARLGRPLLRAVHWLNRNTRQGSRRNIAAHYDLGNALFEQLLDPSMMYSAAMFRTPEDSLEQAQQYKLQRICQKLDLSSTDHLLEIGTGWGGLAIYAARHYGCRVTTTTVSAEQYAYARQRIESEGLQDRITLLLEDYRDLQGQFDKLVSIEMIEAVGHRYLSTYFKQCARLLKPDGLMLLQSITIREQRYAQARRSVDFIQRYIFPGGALPSVSVLMQVLGRDTDLNLHHMEDFGLHYARTLRCWHQHLQRARQTLHTLGYDDSFYRLWEFYLCYCEGGFMERAIGTAQLLLAKPEARPAPLLGQLG
ncbi:class I SAM-dependent methyltransferase [Pseudomonas sp. MAFF212428]|uniref:Class I SAM-dependent methyltransferase n=1 Tax=Pseudomonas brassicae TaxID=2708063 RepID=A0A6B3NSM9_9PSED|nr:cyclopropane-fatty-acyl-phospholipid synthase family protein [Pseudomonas brassicae]NER61325.1 class I SAM-dependent methyltransferase [Pseudomonas brassicae]NER64061.1 class I SAM-dependent methyltransferase [Pseudomonas brassicae]